MHRRQFLSCSLAASALALTNPAQTLAAAQPAPEFYELRRYALTSGPHPKMAEAFFADALIPALNRMGMSPIGAFAVDYGPETPSYYLLVPATSVEALVTADLHLAHDDAFMKAAAPFWNTPATSPAFIRVESDLMRAFVGYPKMTPPTGAALHAKRIFQLRIYESPTLQDHVRKVEMFNEAEFEIFARSGCGAVLYSDVLVGSRLPKLTYLLSFPDMAALDIGWDKFRNDPQWKKLAAEPKYAFEATVSNTTNLILKPLACSQI